MPEGYRKVRPLQGKDFTLRKAAADNILLIVRCHSCRRPAVRYLATDLLALCDPDDWADAPPFPCSKCGTRDYVKVTFHYPALGDYGHLYVRRPAGVKRTQLWKTVRLGDETG